MGILYIISTPIGNLSDITFRALDLLRECDIILCEDTRITGKMLYHFQISKKMISFYQQKEKTAIPHIINLLKDGNQNIALVTDNGTPTISDPGYKLVQSCYENNIEVFPVPGPSACIAALSVSGISADSFYFVGFLPKKPGKKTKMLQYCKRVNGALIFYESPFRLIKTLEAMIGVFGENSIVFIARELTKKFEEKKKGSLLEIHDYFSRKSVKGEIVIILDNYKKKFMLEHKDDENETDEWVD